MSIWRVVFAEYSKKSASQKNFFWKKIQKIDFFDIFFKILKKVKKSIFWIFSQKKFFCDAHFLEYSAKTTRRIDMVASAKFFYFSRSLDSTYF